MQQNYSNEVEAIIVVISCQQLTGMKWLSTAGAFLRIKIDDQIQKNGKLQQQTDIISSQNWKIKIPVYFSFHLQQNIEVQLYSTASNPMFLAMMKVSLAEVINSIRNTYKINLTNLNGNKVITLVVGIEKSIKYKYQVRMDWRGGNIANVDSIFDFYNKSDPYLKFLKTRGANTFIQIHNTEVRKNNLQPNWDHITMPIQKLGFDFKDPHSSFKVECWDHENKQQEHELIGETFVTMSTLRTKKCPIEFILSNPALKKPGKLFLDEVCFIIPPINLLNLLTGGLKTNLITIFDMASRQQISNKQILFQLKLIESLWNCIKFYNCSKNIQAFAFSSLSNEIQQQIDKLSISFSLIGLQQHQNIDGFTILREICLRQSQNQSRKFGQFSDLLIKIIGLVKSSHTKTQAVYLNSCFEVIVIFLQNLNQLTKQAIKMITELQKTNTSVLVILFSQKCSNKEYVGFKVVKINNIEELCLYLMKNIRIDILRCMGSNLIVQSVNTTEIPKGYEIPLEFIVYLI